MSRRWRGWSAGRGQPERGAEDERDEPSRHSGHDGLRWLGKVRSYDATRTSPSDSGEVPRWSASQVAVTLTHSGSLRLRGAPGGDRNGESVSTSRRSVGDERRRLGRGFLAGPEDETREADGQAQVDHLPGIVGRSGIRVDDRGGSLPERRDPRRAADPGGTELGEQGVLGVAPAIRRSAMEDGRLARFEGEPQVPAQVRPAGPGSG